MNFGEILKKIRTEKQMSQNDLAQKIGVTQQTIAQYEKAKNFPKYETIKKLSDALGVFDHQLNPHMVMSFDTPDDFNKEWNKITNNLRIKDMSMLMDKMNAAGQTKALEQVELLTKIPEYAKNKE